MALAEDQRSQILERLRLDFPWWSEHCAKIVNTTGQVIPLIPKPAQLRIWQAIQRQREAGKPVRIIVPKARKEGVSTMAVALAIQRVTLTANHNAIGVAQDASTAAELLQMATLMHANLPDSAEWPVKPPIANRERKKELVFGNPARIAQATGDFGINSRIRVDTAAEFEAGRGFTFHTVHCSEPAFWPDLKRKLTSLLNAVPDEPETMVILESTSNGHNHWRDLCMQAQDGLNDFEIVFLPWFDEPQYVRAFGSEHEREEFIDSIGTGDFGTDEPELLSRGLSFEQLHWRRWAIANRTQGDIRIFHQEYPATLEESFLSSGRQVFNQMHVGRAREAVEAVPEPEKGTFDAKGMRTRRMRYGTVEIPEGPEWKTGKGQWEVWEHPDPLASYIVAHDPAGDEVMDEEKAAMKGVVIIDHKTGMQVAQLETQADADLLARQIYLAALYYNRAWVAVETTGGWGLSTARKLHYDFAYPFVFKGKRLTASKDKTEDRLGFDTNRTSKVILEDGAREMLREGSHGLRSRKIVRQLTTYVKNVKGAKSGPAPGERSDLLMSWMIAHQVRLEVHPTARQSKGPVDTTSRGAYATYVS